MILGCSTLYFMLVIHKQEEWSFNRYFNIIIPFQRLLCIYCVSGIERIVIIVTVKI